MSQFGVIQLLLIMCLSGCAWNNKTLTTQVRQLDTSSNIVLERDRYFVISNRQHVGFRVDADPFSELFYPVADQVIRVFWRVTALKEGMKRWLGLLIIKR